MAEMSTDLGRQRKKANDPSGSSKETFSPMNLPSCGFLQRSSWRQYLAWSNPRLRKRPGRWRSAQPSQRVSGRPLRTEYLSPWPWILVWAIHSLVALYHLWGQPSSSPPQRGGGGFPLPAHCRTRSCFTINLPRKPKKHTEKVLCTIVPAARHRSPD